jgi:FixJ family two-component response regulator
MAERPLVAIVDDDESIRNATRDLLRAAGFSTATFEDAESFLGSTSRASAACVVADIRMPGMTGLELYQALVASGDGIPTVIITAHPEDATRSRARSGNHVLPQQAVRPGRAGRVRARSAREASRSYT